MIAGLEADGRDAIYCFDPVGIYDRAICSGRNISKDNGTISG